jgi:hypothetical protein
MQCLSQKLVSDLMTLSSLVSVRKTRFHLRGENRKLMPSDRAHDLSAGHIERLGEANRVRQLLNDIMQLVQSLFERPALHILCELFGLCNSAGVNGTKDHRTPAP